MIFESARLLVVKSIPEMGFSAAHKPLFISLRSLQKNGMRLSIPLFRTTCLLNVFCGEFYINVILTSKTTHFAERHVVYCIIKRVGMYV
jgi:hypothetical protein